MEDNIEQSVVLDKVYRTLLKLAIPIAFQSLVQSSLSVIDQMMVARLGETAMAAAGIALRPLTILFFMLMGLSGALNVFVAQYWGDGQIHKIGQVLKLALKYGIIIVCPVLVMTFFMPQFTMKIFTEDTMVVEKGAHYLRIISGSFPPLILTILLSGILKSCGKVGVPVKAGIVAVIANTVLNYILIYGLGTFKGWGIGGAAAATVMARLIEATIICLGIYKTGILKTRLERAGNSDREGVLNKQFKKVAYPLLVSEFIFICSITFYAILYGRMGTLEMAAMTLLFPLQNIAFGLFSGMSTASATLVGQALGKGEFKYAKSLSQYIMNCTFLLGVLLSLIIALTLPFYLNLYHLDVELYKKANGLILVAAFILPIQIMNMVIYEGVLRTGGKTDYLVKIQLATLWAIGIPAGVITGFVLKLPLSIVFFAVSFEEMVRFTISYYKMHQEVWIARIH